MDYNFYLYLAGLVVVSFIAGKILAPAILWALSKTVAKTKTSLDDRILSEIRGPVESFFFLFIIYAAVHYISIFRDYVSMTEKYAASAVIIVGAFLAMKIAKAVSHWYFEEGHKASGAKIDISLLPLLYKTSQILIIFIAFALLLGEFGFDLTALLAFTSIVGVIVGFASQEIPNLQRQGSAR